MSTVTLHPHRRRTIRKDVELVLHNEKTSPIDLRVVQAFAGRWKMMSASHPHVRSDASSAQWRRRC